MLFFPLIHVKMPTIVGILTFMSRKNFTQVEHEKSFITSGPGQRKCTGGGLMDWLDEAHLVLL